MKTLTFPGRSAWTAAALVLVLAACGGGGDGEPDGGSMSRLFVADSGNSNIVTSVNSNPSAGPLRTDRTISGPSVSPNMPDLVYDSGNDRLYIANNNSIAVLNNAGTRNGSSIPDRTIGSGSITTSIAAMFLDTANDILYVVAGSAGTVLAFNGASTANGNVVPARSLLISRTGTGALMPINDIYVDTTRDILYVSARVSGVSGVNSTVQSYNNARALPDSVTLTPNRVLDFTSSTIADIVGDRTSDRIFVADTNVSILVFDNASNANNVAASRTITFDVDAPRRLALAPVNNRLYSLSSGRNGVNIIDNAGSANGTVSPTLVTSSSAGNFSAIAVAP